MNEKQFIEVFVSEIRWDISQNRWRAYIYDETFSPTTQYFKVRIPLPDEYVKNYLGTLEADKPILTP